MCLVTHTSSSKYTVEPSQDILLKKKAEEKKALPRKMSMLFVHTLHMLWFLSDRFCVGINSSDGPSLLVSRGFHCMYFILMK